ncbi:MAG: ATP-binding protein [Pseudomonadota bacterium]|nr:ATP-binding protein [Pseudomonadota bacterium]
MNHPISIGRGSRLLSLYSYYSLILALSIVVVDGLDSMDVIVGKEAPHLFLVLSSLYVLAAAVFVALITRTTDSQGATTYLFLETALLTGMMFASGGLTAGFSSLLLIPVVMANLLAPGILGYSVAAWLSLAVIYTEHIAPGEFGIRDTANTGVYGGICFALAWLTQLLSHRIDAALNLAQDTARDVQRLQRLSQQALMKLPDGIIACSKEKRILFINDTAASWLKLEPGAAVPEWLITAPTQESLAGKLQGLTVTRLEAEGPDEDCLLLIEDEARLSAEVQQAKLASLGRLTASIAHEIRNPLSALNQAAQLLDESEHLPAEDKKLTAIIENNSQRINRIIGAILQLSRGKRPTATPLKLHSYVDNFCQNFRQVSGENCLIFSYDADSELTVLFDPDHLNQVLTNLCQNGLRHARKARKQEAEVVLRILSESDSSASLEITDNGFGIADNQVSRLFEPFNTTEHDGTGLGLYLCRELCQANQASIEFAGNDPGARFLVRMKRA